MARTRLLVGLAVFPLVVTLLALAAPAAFGQHAPTRQGFSHSGTKASQGMVFVRNCSIWRANLQGKKAKRIVKKSGMCLADPTISKSGKYVGYTKLTVKRGWYLRNVWILNTKTKKKRALTHDGHSYNPDFSPTSDRIAFNRTDKWNTRSNIATMNASGKKVHLITHLAAGVMGAGNPSWNDSGKSVYYNSGQDGYECTLDDDGTQYMGHPIFLLYNTKKGKVTRDRQLDVTDSAQSGKHLAYVAQRIKYTQPKGLCNGHEQAGGLPSNTWLYVDGKKRVRADGGVRFNAAGTKLYFASTTGKIAMIKRSGGAAKMLVKGSDPDIGKLR